MDHTTNRDPLEAAAELFAALSTPGRLRILRRLAETPACVHELVQELGMSQPLVSQHLRVLRQTGLAQGSRRGRETVYSATDAHVVRIVADAVEHASERSRPGSDNPLQKEEHSP